MTAEKTDWKSPVLREWHQAVRDVNRRVETLFAARDAAALTARPAPDRWNAVECLGHLMETGNQYYPVLRETLERYRAEGRTGDGQYRPGWFARWFIGMVEPASTRAVPTVRSFEPRVPPDDLDIRDRFLAQQDILLSLLHDADGLDLNGPRFSSPVTVLVRLTLGEGLRLQVAHQERHVGQAERAAAG